MEHFVKNGRRLLVQVRDNFFVGLADVGLGRKAVHFCQLFVDVHIAHVRIKQQHADWRSGNKTGQCGC